MGVTGVDPSRPIPRITQPKTNHNSNRRRMFCQCERLPSLPWRGRGQKKLLRFSASDVQEVTPGRKQSMVNRGFTLCVKKADKTTFQASPREDDANLSPNILGT